ncbi:unnamed protein product, partial [Ectocarpus sp. 12 AP-2014]
MHSLVDSANQLLLVVGLRSASTAPDKRHQYGYAVCRARSAVMLRLSFDGPVEWCGVPAVFLATGKSVYFWALVSALGTFWLGAGVSMRH